MTERADPLGSSFARFADEIGRAAPTYGAICRGVAAVPEVLALLDGIPTPQRRPVLLLAAVHHRLLELPDESLARHYRTITPEGEHGDPVPEFIAFCAQHADALRSTIARRSTQTNDVGRAALIYPTLLPVAARTEKPIGLVDIGTSAGLNLHLDRFAYHYHDEDGGEVRLPGHAPELDCLVRGTSARALLDGPSPRIGHRVGVDPTPIDPSDPEEARWLLACLWPDQVERVDRLRAALILAADYRHEVEILTGSGVDRASEAVRRSRATGSCPIVLNTWSLTYFHPEERATYVNELDRLGEEDDLAWVYLEAPNETPELPWGEVDRNISLSVLRRIDWQSGRRTETTVGIAHPHGRWIDVTDR
jgi:hypothetical protein